MKNKYTIPFLILMLCGLLGGLKAQDANKLWKPELLLTDNVKKDVFRIKFEASQFAQGALNKKASAIGTIEMLNKHNRITEMKRVFPFSMHHEAQHRKHGLHLWYELELPAGSNMAAVMEQYAKQPEVALVKPVMNKINYDGVKLDSLTIDSLIKVRDSRYKKAVAATAGNDFNDPELPKQWHYENDGSVGSFNEDIDLFDAWEITTGSSDVIVAVVDGGVDVNHQDLKPNLWVNTEEQFGQPGVDDDNNGYIDDIHGWNFKRDKAEITPVAHGTHVAGTVGAVNNNNIGVAGVAGGDGTNGSGVKIISCQIFESAGDSGGSAAAIVYGADNGAVISQNSWGYSIPGYMEPEVEAAIYYFREEAGQYEGSPMKGGILFFAAGNTGRNERHMPGAHEAVYGVASVGATGYPSSFSTHGDWVDITGPGGDFDFGQDGEILSTFPNNSYGYFSGTSMACPHVSGVAALVLSNSDKQMTPDELWSQLSGGARPFKFESYGLFGVGMLNAKGALVPDAGIAPEAITDLEILDPSFNTLKLSWTVPVDEDNEAPSMYYIAISEEDITAENFYNSPYVFAMWNDFKAGTGVEVEISGFKSDKQYYSAIISEDSYRNTSEISNVASARTTNPPVFTLSQMEYIVELDTDNPVKQFDLRLANEGEGTLEWRNITHTNNLEQYWGYYKNTIKNKIDQYLEDAQQAEGFSAKKAGTSAMGIHEEKKHWDDDQTVLNNYLSYDAGDYMDFATSTENESSIASAVRFDVPPGGSINLTHVEWAMYVDSLEIVNEAYIEIRKGKSLESAEVLTQQAYDPKRGGKGFVLHRTGLMEPQFFVAGESFWVLVYHPMGEKWGLAYQVADGNQYYPEYFYTSTNGGTSWEDAQAFFYRHIYQFTVPLMRAGTTGMDGSFVFLNPTSGELAEGEHTDATITVDNSTLDNGDHWGSLTFFTNDPESPFRDVDVYVRTSGKTPDVSVEQQTYRGYAGVKSKMDLHTKNSGGDTLQILRIYTEDGAVDHRINDTLTLLPKAAEVIQVAWTPNTVAGYEELDVKYETVHGLLSFPVETIVKEAPTAQLDEGNNNLSLGVSETAKYTFEIENTSSEADLNYDLSHYFNSKETGTVQTFDSYKMEVFNDPSRWEDIQALDPEERLIINPYEPKFWELGIDPVMYDQRITNFKMQYEGILSNNEFDVWPEDYFPARAYAGPTLVPFFQFEMQGYKSYWSDYAFGDHAVYSIRNTWPYEPINNTVRVEFQVAVYDDGVIEYRYRDVTLPDTLNYQVGMQSYDAVHSSTFSDGSDDFVNGRLESGMVIRFTPETDMSSNMIVDANVREGVLKPGEKKSIELTLEPAMGVSALGDYEVPFYVTTNIVGNRLTGHINVSLSDSPSFEYEPEVEISSFSNHHNAELWKITNKSFTELKVADIDIDNALFTMTDMEVGDTLKAQAEIFAHVVFAPQGEQVAQEANIVITLSNGEQIELSARGNVELSPEIAVDFGHDGTFEFTQLGEELFSVSVDQGDAGLGDYTLVGGKYTSTVATKTSSSADSTLFEGRWDTDRFGYRKQVMREGTVAFKWEDGDDFTNIDFEEGVYHEVDLDFDFHFYDESFDKMWISNNGYVTFTDPGDLSYDPVLTKGHLGMEIYREDEINSMIAAMVNHNSIDGEAELRLYRRDDHMVIRWMNIKDMLSINRQDVEMFLYDNGDIYFSYRSVEGWDGPMQVMLESKDETFEYDILLQEGRLGGADFFRTDNDNSWDPLDLGDSTVIKIARPYKFNKVRGSQTDIQFRVNTELLPENGVYTDTLLYVSNNPKEGEIKWPVTITLDAPGSLHVENMDTGLRAMDAGDELSQEIVFANRGTEPISLGKVKAASLNEFKLYLDGEELTVSSSGNIVPKIKLAPLSELKLTIGFQPNVPDSGSADIQWYTNSEMVTSQLTYSTIGMPRFEFDVPQVQYTMQGKDTLSVNFDVTNAGQSDSDYELKVFGVNDIEFGSDFPYVFEDKLPLTLGAKVFANWEIALDEGYDVEVPLAINQGGVALEVANQFRTGVEPHRLTHIGAELKLLPRQVDAGLRVKVLAGTDHPDDAEVIYDAFYATTKDFDRQWLYFKLEQALEIPANTNYWLVINYPSPAGNQTMAFEPVTYVLQDDPEVNTSTGWINWEDAKGKDEIGEDEYFFGWQLVHEEKPGGQWDGVFRIRPILGSEEIKGLKVDPQEGALNSGASLAASMQVSGYSLNAGENHLSLVMSDKTGIISTTESIYITVDAAPEWKYTPNQYGQAQSMRETEELELSYIAQDPEGSAVKFEVEGIQVRDTETGDLMDFEGPDAFIRSTAAGQAKLLLEADYDAAGEHRFAVKAIDANGNVAVDTLNLTVENANRLPVFDEEYRYVYLNLADPSAGFGMNLNEVFQDPDGDELGFLFENLYPDVAEVAAGSRYIDIHPVAEGVGIVLVAAYDEPMGQLVIEPIYVIVYTDQEEANATPNGIRPDDLNIGEEQYLLPYPNPVTDGNSYVAVRLDKDADVELILMDSFGRVVQQREAGHRPAGVHSFNFNVEGLSNGVYIYQLVIDGEAERTAKILVQ